ncbi:hypothetical protein, partial [Actinophytocola sediminis]
MSWFKAKRKSAPGPAADEPTFVSKETHPNGAVYETYLAQDAVAAKAFLLAKKVDQDLYYIVVETPQGNWGTDVEGLYLENLLPWQLNTSDADCVGNINSVTNTFGLLMAASEKIDNFVAEIRCGRCAHRWHDGLRYQNRTLVRCPHCKTGNNVDSSGVVVSHQPDRQTTVIMSSHTVSDASWVEAGDDGERDAVLAGVDQAVTVASTAVTGSPPGHPHRPGRLFHLGSALEERFDRAGDGADLDAAITAFVESANATRPADAERVVRLAAVGRTLTARFELAGRPAD